MNQSKILLAVVIALVFQTLCAGQNQQRRKIITRVFWQDAVTQNLKYADLSTTDRWHIKTGRVSGPPIAAGPNDSLGQMIQSGKQILLANNSSGVLFRIDSGVTEEPHGSHFHWTYSGVPNNQFAMPGSKVSERSKLIGEFAYFSHLDGGFSKVPFASNSPLQSFSGGGPEPAIAIANNGIAYATHNGASGAGKVDVVNMNGGSGSAVGSFNIPSGNLVAAEANSGKAFFASANNVSWIRADGNAAPDVYPVSVTGELNIAGPMVSEKNWVLFTSNSDSEKALCMIDGAAGKPSILKLPIATASGLKLSAPKTKLSLGKRFAFIFQERLDSNSGAVEQLTIVELDPNRDQKFNDAKVSAHVSVGASKVDGNRGRHDICFDDYGRFAIFTNPTDGMLTIMTLNDMKVRARFNVGGTPDRIVAVGSPEHFH